MSNIIRITLTLDQPDLNSLTILKASASTGVHFDELAETATELAQDYVYHGNKGGRFLGTITQFKRGPQGTHSMYLAGYDRLNQRITYDIHC
jgi:hypothetical protein